MIHVYGEKHLVYKDMLEKRVSKIVSPFEAKRGRILDRNGIVLVDNIETNDLYYFPNKKINTMDVAKSLSMILNDNNPSEKALIKYYKALYDYRKLLTSKEKKLLNERKKSLESLSNKLNERILDKTSSFSKEEKNIAYIYNLLTSSTYNEPSLVVKDLSDEEVEKIVSLNIGGLEIKNGYKRVYPYQDVLRDILGKTGKITKENKNEFLKRGYNLDDEVGISYLESEYEEYLKGKKAKYIIKSDSSLKMIEKEQSGNDIMLSIDINLQLELEKAIKDNLIEAKKRANTKYLTESYSILSNPKTGEIIAFSGQRINSDNTFSNANINLINSSYTLGSVVKGATISVGYKYNLIEPHAKLLDKCIKLNHITEKCSYKQLGYIDAISALENSSNYYQFQIAINLTGQKYTPNMDLQVSQREFKIYRDMLASYGLGIETGIDLPGEKTGQIGKKVTPDLLLNLSIGQYDTYTPIELSTYINTLASNGLRKAPSLVKKIIRNNKIVYENRYEVIDRVPLNEEDFSLIKEGFIKVMSSGTGWGSFNNNLKPAGKTGTSESFLDTNLDGKIDTQTTTLTLAGYFPYDNPKYSLVVISPHVSYKNPQNDYVYYVSAHISRQFTDFMFENGLVS